MCYTGPEMSMSNKKTLSKASILALAGVILLSVCLPLTAAEQAELFEAAVPIILGEEALRERLPPPEKTTALVLSGGSARAFAHIGILKYLEERSIIPDLIVSNSMGSIVGLLYAAGLSPFQIEQLVSQTDIASLFSLSLPTGGGVLDVSAFTDMLYHYLGDLELSELEIPILVVCEDLRSRRPVYLADGDFYEVMEASFALPVYFDPVDIGQFRLIDGGITNLLHLEAAYPFARRVITSTTFYDNPELNLSNPLTILNVSMDIGKRREGVKDLLEYDPILIRCDVEDFSFMDFASLEEIAARGYRSAQESLWRLEGIPKRAIPQGILDFRRQFDLEFEKKLTALESRGSIPPRESRTSVSFQTVSTGRPADATPFYDDLYASMGYGLQTRDLDVNISLGLSLDTRAFSSLLPALGVEASYLTGERTRLSVASRFFLKPDQTHLLESTVSLQARRLLTIEPFGLSLQGGIWLRGFDGFQQPVTSRAALSLGLSTLSGLYGTSASLEAGFRYEGWQQSVLFARTDSRLRLARQLQLGFKGSAALPVFGSDEVLYFPCELYRSSEVEGIRDLYAGIEVGLDLLLPAFSFTTSEVLLFRDLILGPYGTLFYDTSLSWSAGLHAGITVSLIGVESTRVDLYSGYDSESGSVTGGVILGF